jgi:PAS domain S-box-containing protein
MGRDDALRRVEQEPAEGKLMSPALTRFVVVLVGLCAVAITAFAWRDARRVADEEARNRFEFRVDEMVDTLRARIADYEQVLRGVTGLFAVSGSIDEKQWLIYHAALRLEETYPAVRGLGFATWKDGRAMTRYIAPPTRLNLSTLGFDVYTDPVRRAAIDLARDTGEATLTARAILRSDPERQPSALLVLPIYRHGTPVATFAARRDRLVGLVYVGFRFSDLVRISIGDTPAIGYRLVDVTDGQPVTLYDTGHDAQPGAGAKSTLVPLRGRVWRLDAAQLPGFARSDRPRLVLAGGLATSLLLTILVWSLLNTRRHAHDLVRRMLATSEELERFRLAIDRHSDSMLMVDAERMRIVYVNEGGCRNLGYARDELIGQPPDIIFADRDAAILNKEYGNLATSDGAVAVERAVHRRKDGTSFPVEISRQVLRGRDRTFVLGVARDLTERIAREHAVRESEERLALALESSGLALFDWDLRTGLVQLGAEWRHILEDPAASIATPIQKLQALVHPDDVPSLLEEIRKLLAGDTTVYRIQHRVRTGAGGWKWIESVAKVNERDATGRALRITGTNADITERRAVETMKNDFIAGVSHELRTPLTGIVASLALLKEGVAGELPPEAAQFVDIAHGNSERLAALIGDILDLERIESGGLRLEMQALDVAPLVRQAAELNAAYAQRYKASVEVRAGEALPARADPHRLLQVLANLISNAAKFSPPGGRILLYGYREPGRVVVSVSDQGPGIPPEFLGRLFGRFEQADGRKPGTGLGLAISKALVEKMGGRIRCESEPGRGATFFVELPV